jgi:2'-hydroxyisoflavone reductase
VRLLILGGTVFLGRGLVDAACRRGHEVTLFNRGQSAPDVFSQVEQLRGDRDRGLDSLRRRSWDAVIDTSGFVPRVVRDSAQLLASSVERYVFVSSLSAYGDFSRPGLTEAAPVAELSEPDSEDVERYYGALKAGCEREVRAAFDERSLIVRPGLIVGPHDPTERFTYWVRRLAAGGPVLAPRACDQRVQLIDVRDLSEWMIAMVERGAGGTYNATGPAQPLTFTAMLERMQAEIGPGALIRWIDEEQLAEAGVEPWEDLPLWLDVSRQPDFAGFLDVDISRALASGLSLRDVGVTAADTLGWAEQNPAAPVMLFGEPARQPGLEPAREQQLLSAST